MKMPLHTLDPDGDIMLVLHNPGAPFAVWNENAAPDPESEPDPEKERPIAVVLESEPVADVHYRLSSRHLALASRYFKKLLAGPWNENKQISDGCRYLSAEGWDPDALLVLMQVIHGRTRSLPSDMSLELLAKIAVLVDYYDCHEPVELLAMVWIRTLTYSMPTTLSRDAILWIVVSWVFDQYQILEGMTELAVQQSKGPILTPDLPVSDLLDVVDAQRQLCVGRIITHLYHMLDNYRDGNFGCTFECSSIMLGALDKEMHRVGILQPRPEPPYSGYSVTATVEMVRGFKSPTWYSRWSSDPHYCNFELETVPLIQTVYELAQGIKLGDVKPRE